MLYNLRGSGDAVGYIEQVCSPEAVARFRADQVFYYFLPLRQQELANVHDVKGPLFVLLGCTRTKTSGHPHRYQTHPNKELRARIAALPKDQQDAVLREGRWTMIDDISPHGIFVASEGRKYFDELVTPCRRSLVGPCLEAEARRLVRDAQDALVGTSQPMRAAAIAWLKLVRRLSIEPVWIK